MSGVSSKALPGHLQTQPINLRGSNIQASTETYRRSRTMGSSDSSPGLSRGGVHHLQPGIQYTDHCPEKLKFDKVQHLTLYMDIPISRIDYAIDGDPRNTKVRHPDLRCKIQRPTCPDLPLYKIEFADPRTVYPGIREIASIGNQKRSDFDISLLVPIVKDPISSDWYLANQSTCDQAQIGYLRPNFVYQTDPIEPNNFRLFSSEDSRNITSGGCVLGPALLIGIYLLRRLCLHFANNRQDHSENQPTAAPPRPAVMDVETGSPVPTVVAEFPKDQNIANIVFCEMVTLSDAPHVEGLQVATTLSQPVVIDFLPLDSQSPAVYTAVVRS